MYPIMRTTFIDGIEDNLKIEIPGNVELICTIMEVGKGRDPITFEACLSGEKLLKILEKCYVRNIADFGIQKDNHYNVTAWDW